MNNLGQVTAEKTFDGSGLTITDDSNGNPQEPSASLLVAETQEQTDADGNNYFDEQLSVSPTTGAASGGETSQNWYDADGNVVASEAPNGVWTKTVYNDDGEVSATYTTDGSGDNPFSVSGDVVYSQQEFQYDDDGNTILTTTYSRLPTASAGATGPLTASDSAVDYLADYYDSDDRVTDQVDFGNNGGVPFTRPDTPPSPGSTDALVTHTDYDDAGNVLDTIDPKGIETRYAYDALGNQTEVINAYDPSINSGNPTNSNNQTTTYTYDGDGNMLTQTAVMPSGTPSQTTQYVYGNGTSAGEVVKTEYPDPTTGAASTSPSNDVSYTYDDLDNKLTMTDQNGTTHTYTYDALGRMTLDAVTTLGAGVDGSVRAIGYTYNAQGLPYQQTSYSDAAGTTIVNQDQDQYNGLGQLTAEYQSISGPVDTATTPDVQYVYGSPSTGSNMTEMIYPNGRILHYGYNNVGQVTYLADDNGSGGVGAHLVDYSYQGLSTIVGQAYGNGVDETTTLDPFGDVAQMNYVNDATGTSTDDFEYSYDADGNVLYKENMVNPAFSELYTYDSLSRLTSFERGTLSSSGGSSTLDQITDADLNSLPGSSQSWDLDAVGNQTAVTTDGTTTNRTANSQNELTGAGSSTLTYDNNGNMTTDQNGDTYTYNAWNQIVAVKNSSGATIASYTYDANGRRTSQDESGVTTDFYLSTQDQVLEERQDSVVTAQNVWSIDYVNDLVLRDDNSTSGSLGISESGLGTRTYYQHDANFDVTATTNASGNVIDRYVYSPYGVQTVLTPTWATSGHANSVYGFQGGRYDIATGMNDFQNRDYSPSLAVWMQKDPAGYPAGMNSYQAFTSDPVSLVDPAGENPATTRPAGAEPAPGTYSLSYSGETVAWVTPVITTHDLGDAENAGVTIKLIIDRPTDSKSISVWNDQFKQVKEYATYAGQLWVPASDKLGPANLEMRVGPNMRRIATGEGMPKGGEDATALVIEDDRRRNDDSPLVSSKWTAIDNPSGNDTGPETDVNKVESDTFDLNLGDGGEEGDFTILMYSIHTQESIMRLDVTWSYDGKPNGFQYKINAVPFPKLPSADFDFVKWANEGNSDPNTTEDRQWTD